MFCKTGAPVRRHEARTARAARAKCARGARESLSSRAGALAAAIEGDGDSARKIYVRERSGNGAGRGKS